jgi:hypothetical protein
MEIKEYPNYLIFRNGAVLSKGSKYNKPRFLKHCFNTAGYKVVCLRDGKGGGRPRFIHRLLAEQYIPNPENKPFVDHIDRNKTNNNLCNLRWVTSKENNNNMPPVFRINKNNTTGHKCISKTERGYRLQINRRDVKVKKRFKHLDDAIEYRDNLINA